MAKALTRLKRRSEFLAVAGAGHKAVAPGLVLQAMARADGMEDGLGIRAGFTASRRVGGAVERNRAKRRLRAVADEVLPRAARPGCDYVLIGRAGTLKRPFEKLLRDLEGTLGRAGFLKETAGTGEVGRRTS